tara:strand:- start:129 stop:911 length:783 start_codon:yes stop_codon:yes gene_type:complete
MWNIILAPLLLSTCQQIFGSFDRWNAYLNYVEYLPTVNATYPVHVTFENMAEYPVHIHKIRSMYDKDMTFPIQFQLPPNEKIKVTCEIGDTFMARAIAPGTPDHNRVLLTHDVARVYVTENVCEQEEKIQCERKPFSGTRWTPPDSFVFTNRYHNDVHLYYYDNQCEEQVGEVQPNMDHHIQSTVGHKFRIRDASTTTLLQEHTLSEVPIYGLKTNQDFELSEKAATHFIVRELNVLKKNVEIQSSIIEELEQSISKHTC